MPSHGHPPLTRNPNPYPLPNGYIMRVTNKDGTQTYKALPADDVEVRCYLSTHRHRWQTNWYTGRKVPSNSGTGARHFVHKRIELPVQHLVHKRIELPEDFYWARADREMRRRETLRPAHLQKFKAREVGRPLEAEPKELKQMLVEDDDTDLARDDDVPLPSDRYAPGSGSVLMAGRRDLDWVHRSMFQENAAQDVSAELDLGLRDIMPAGPEYTVRFVKPKKRRGKHVIAESAEPRTSIEVQVAEQEQDAWSSFDVEDQDWDILSVVSEGDFVSMNSLASSAVLVEYYSDPES